MLNIKIQEGETKTKWWEACQLPFLVRHISGNTIIMVTKINKSTSQFDGMYVRTGIPANCLLVENFEPFNGVISLSNKLDSDIY